MSRTTLAAVFLSLATAAPLLGQAQSGHVYAIRYHQVHQGQDAAYNAVYAEVVRPVLDELVKRGVIVSYLDLTQARWCRKNYAYPDNRIRKLGRS